MASLAVKFLSVIDANILIKGYFALRMVVTGESGDCIWPQGFWICSSDL